MGCIADHYHQSWLQWSSLACDLFCSPYQSGWDLIILLRWDHLIGTFGSQIILLMCVRINQDAFMCGYVMAIMSHVDYFTPTHSVRGYFVCKDFRGEKPLYSEFNTFRTGMSQGNTSVILDVGEDYSWGSSRTLETSVSGAGNVMFALLHWCVYFSWSHTSWHFKTINMIYSYLGFKGQSKPI